MFASSPIVSGRGTVGIRSCGRDCVRGTTIIETIAITNVATLIAPMKAGRCRALRARFASQVWREMARRRSVPGRVRTSPLNAKGGRKRARLCHLRKSRFY
jgi:hypothetical protein